MSKNEEKNNTQDQNEIRTWVERDLNSAVALLNLIRLDPEIMKAIGDIVVNRTLAAREQEKAESSKQPING